MVYDFIAKIQIEANDWKETELIAQRQIIRMISVDQKTLRNEKLMA